MQIEQYIYGMDDDGQAIVVYVMSAENGSQVELCNLGATILSVRVPDRNGEIDDVALGYSSLEQMRRDCAFVGRTVGRVANRIERGEMIIDGKEYLLENNNGSNHLHGGSKGFHTRLWESRVETNRVVMSLHSEDGDGGYPASVDVEAIFDYDDHGTLEVTYRAVSDATTVVNITSHAYFNLSGVDGGSVLDHQLKLCSSSVLEMNENQIPTGESLPTVGTSMDFSAFRPLRDAIEGDFNRSVQFRGLDHFFEVDGYKPSILALNAQLKDPASGRQMSLYSSAPGLMVYTGNYLAQGSPISKNGERFVPYQGVALECQIHPNAVNTPHFPSVVLSSGELFCQKIVFKFETF